MTNPEKDSSAEIEAIIEQYSRQIDEDVRFLASLFSEVDKSRINDLYVDKFKELFKIATVTDKSLLLIITRRIIQDELLVERTK